MTAPTVTLTALPGIPLIEPGADLAAILAAAVGRSGLVPAAGDVLVVAQKIVSKAERRQVDLAGVTPSARAFELAGVTGKDPRLLELVLRESDSVIRAAPNVIIVAHRLGLVMANAGIDQSNVRHPDGGEAALLLPVDPDASASRLKGALDQRFGIDFGVIIADSFGRAWRNGVTGVAIGAAGLPALVSRIGDPDLFGRPLRMTEIGFADEIATAAALLMGQADEALPAVLVRGLAWSGVPVPAVALIRPSEKDLFR